MNEQTLALLKPDATERQLTERITSIYSLHNMKIVAQKDLLATPPQIQALYQEHKDRDFFPSLCAYMLSAPIVALILEGEDIIERLRSLHGATDPTMATPGTIRHAYGLSKRFNTVHGTASKSDALRECSIFF